MRDTNYLNPVLVGKPIVAATGFLHLTRYKAWYEAQQVYYESVPSAIKLGWNTLILLRNSVENFCSHMAYGLRTHNRDHPDDRMTVIDLVRLVQQHPDDLDALLAYAVNCFQALNVCAKTLRMYVIDYSYEWPAEEDLKGAIEEILTLLSGPPPTGAGLPDTISIASYKQIRIETGLLADYSLMNDAFKMWNQSIDDMEEDIVRGQRPGHVYLMPGDMNFPRPVAAHPPWARSVPRVGEPDITVPEGPAYPTSHPAPGSATPSTSAHDRVEHGPKRSRTASDSVPSSSTRPATASEAASSSSRPRPTVGSTSATPNASEPEEPPPEVGWTLPMENTDHILVTHHFKVRSGKVYGTKLAKRRDGGGYVNAIDETPRGVVGKTFKQTYLRRLVTMLARSGGLSANIETGFHLPTYIQKGDEEWLRLYNQVYHLMHLGCTQCLPEPAVLAACVFDDRAEEWVCMNFPEDEIVALRNAESKLLEAMHAASREDATVWKGSNTVLVMDGLQPAFQGEQFTCEDKPGYCNEGQGLGIPSGIQSP